MITPRYAANAYEQAYASSQLPNSPASRGIRSRVPGTSARLEQLHKISVLRDLIAADPWLSAAGWLVAP